MGESLQERQENELKVLEAIYIGDFHIVEENAKVDTPHIVLKLQPCESMKQHESHVSLDLNIKYHEEYPNMCPVLRLENAKGISNDKVLELEREIQCMAADLVGEVMILQLAQHVQNFLHQNNVPPPTSFYEEMMAKKERDREQKKANELAKKEKEQKENFMQIKEEEEQIKEEMSRREKAKQSLKEKESNRVGILSQVVPESLSTNNIEEKPLRLKKKTSCEEDLSYDGLRVVVFENHKQHIVHCGKCLGCGRSGSSVFCGLDIITGELVALTEWILRRSSLRDQRDQSSTKIENEKLSKQVSSIENEVNSLVKRVDHHNLVHYFGFAQNQNNSVLKVQVLTEFVAGSSLLKEIETGCGVPIATVRDYCQQLLDVLAYLHGKSIMHKDLKLSSVFLDQDKTIRLADYSVGKRLNELYQSYGEHKIPKKTRTNELKITQKANKESDIVNLGLLMLSLLEGDVVNSVPPTIPQSFPPELQDFFDKCLYPESGSQWSALQLLGHPFISPNPMSHGLSNDITSDKLDAEKDQGRNQNGCDDGDELPGLISIPSGYAANNSRVRNEFEVLQMLGKGGFGSVVKVRNKLDGCLYAIKRIPLNPKSVMFNRKITREVKLLSRLNHENIVRYYNSWIEVEEILENETSNSETKSSMTEDKSGSQVEDSLMKLNVVEAPSVRSRVLDDDLWTNENTNDSKHVNDDKSSSSSVEELQIPKQSSYNTESSEDIMFKRNIDESYIQFGSSLAHVDEESDLESEEEAITTRDLQEDAKCTLQSLYIQMEYCEKSTLRNVIDEGLYKDPQRIWRLLREIVEGLVHVHSQGMIHRDLKPVNIFLDLNDRVKIGDFGLATTHPFTKLSVTGNTNCIRDIVDCNKPGLGNASHSQESLTGKVGTALYVSPELGNNTQTRVKYTQKVDLYSLGIIFFEMCYRPLGTSMERVKVLGNLRTEKILLPEDFDKKRFEKQRQIIRWLLNHNPDERPTSQELLKSQYIPPSIEDNELEEILNHTLAATNSTRYRTLISYVINQDISQNKLDLTYDYELITTPLSGRHSVVQQYVHNKLVDVFLKFGFLRLDTPLLVPKSTMFKHADTTVILMDHSGAILTLPHDLRTSLARYLARNNFPSLKRYSISAVFRDTRILGVHPREISECAIDIAMRTHYDVVPDAEIIYTVFKIINEFPALTSRNYYIRINHVTLIKSILVLNGVADEKIFDIISILQESRNEIDRLENLKKSLENIGISEKNVINVCRWLFTESPIDSAESALGHMIRGRRTGNHRMRNAIQELDRIVKCSQSFGLTMEVVLYPGLVYNIQNMSGVLFQFVSERKRKAKGSAIDILAAGGRYDKLVSLFSRGRQRPPDFRAVGASINIERIVQLVSQDPNFNFANACDVMVCAVGENTIVNEQIRLLTSLRRGGISACLWNELLTDSMLDAVQGYCRDCGVQYMVIVEENAPTRIRIVEKDKETKGVDDPVEFLRQRFHETTESVDREYALNRPAFAANESNGQAQPKFNIEFVTQEKLEKNTRRRYESHMISKVTQILKNFSGQKHSYFIVGVDLPSFVLKSIAVFLDLSDDNSKARYNASVKVICEQLKQPKHRRHVPYVCDKINDVKDNTKIPILFLYSCTDEQCIMMNI